MTTSTFDLVNDPLSNASDERHSRYPMPYARARAVGATSIPARHLTFYIQASWQPEIAKLVNNCPAIEEAGNGSPF